ncbi:MAG: ABC transporter permease [Candidatus Thermoplasmatota archaeon]|nr:ABC transporter permease [Candidatus Thermoplasmatota archaeon]MBU1940515.1 ABC transporter permease [Candidatus Thermoplasmatota archaeon]
MIADIFLMSVDALRSHKIRTLLTLLGVIIGIGSVIMVTTTGQSVERFIEQRWNIFDPTGMLVGTGTNTNPPSLSLTSVVFTDKDVKNIQNLQHVKEAAPVGFVPLKFAAKKEGFLKWKTASTGTMYVSTPLILDVLNLTIEEGRVFTEGKHEIIITRSTTKLFGINQLLNVGDEIHLQRIDGRLLKATIVGIIRETGSTNIISQIMAPSILGPADPYYSTYFGSNVGTLFNRVTAYNLLYVSADNKDVVDVVKGDILSYLNTSSDAKTFKQARFDFVVVTQQYIIERINEIMSVLNMLITSIALISLAVGGIGIANIMYATVTERTREIGTMMAVGAKRRHIMKLFLYQSTVIGIIGGVLGVILGASVSAFVVQVINRYMAELGGASFTGTITVLYPLEWFVIAAFFGIVIGVVAGVLPARKAARMDPVEALRYQ